MGDTDPTPGGGDVSPENRATCMADNYTFYSHAIVFLGKVDGSGPAPRNRDPALDRLVGSAHSGCLRCFEGKMVASDRCSGVYTVLEGPTVRNDCIDIGSVSPVEVDSIGLGVVECLVRAK